MPVSDDFVMPPDEPVEKPKVPPEVPPVVDGGPGTTLVPIKYIKAPRAPSLLSGVRLRTKTPFGHLHMTITMDMKTGRELEIFAQIGKSGEMITAEMEALSRLSSMYLKVGGSMQDIIDQLIELGSTYSTKTEMVSIPASLGQALKKYLELRKAYGVRKLVLGEVELPEEPEEEKPV